MVTSYFQVKPCVGKDMTKRAVLEGLSNSAVVLLGHTWLSLFEGTAIETKHIKAEQADQVFMAAEIATLSISSGLVVLNLFYEILIATPTGKNDVSECLQMVMLQMIHKNAPIRHWAPFTIVGSPMLGLFVPDNN
ncbi:unnamed protein product [Sphagnum jensenii]|uniref:Uncharacterized protein n=1 Tax=Sphagnum jensenii TaxID=128206 RepID=A0ABP1B2H0_9BRYO